MRGDDGREVLLRLELPLAVTVVAALCHAIGEAAERLGYTDVVMLTDGTNRIVATPPGPPPGPRPVTGSWAAAGLIHAVPEDRR